MKTDPFDKANEAVRKKVRPYLNRLMKKEGLTTYDMNLAMLGYFGDEMMDDMGEKKLRSYMNAVIKDWQVTHGHKKTN